jgi:ABC-type lipoprotein export system ATPase subunit
VVVAGADLYTFNESRRALWRGRTLGIVFQFFQLLPMLSLVENVMLPMDYTNCYDFDERPERAMALLRLVGLEAQAYKHPDAVSTGQQQCAAIARALATDPPILVADEPTGNLDSRSAEVILELFTGLVQRGKTIAMVTHDPSLTARVDRTIVICDGELVDETLARALPTLSHRQMLAATRRLTRRTAPPGSELLHIGQPIERIGLVAHGCIELLQPDGSVQARRGPGGHFGVEDLLAGEASRLTVRATPDEPVELVELAADDFRALAAEAPALRALLNGHHVKGHGH